ncbi:hypothetical protein FB451DRAFT_1031164, partial [Mycena latifolia]
YTVAMLDPDAPSAAQPTTSQFRHWVVRSYTFNKPRARFECPYYNPRPQRSPTPPKGSGIYQYSAVRPLREPPNCSLPADAPEREGGTEARRRWDVVKFGERHGLDSEMGGAVFGER